MKSNSVCREIIMKTYKISVDVLLLTVLVLIILDTFSPTESKPDDDTPPEQTETQPPAESDPSATSRTIMPELATGKRIDVTSHKNIQFLPTLQECGLSMKDETLSKPITRMFASKSNIISNKYPWMVRLVNEDSRGMRSLGCAGTIISPRFILTAATCLVGFNTGCKVSNIIVGGHGTTCESGRCSPVTKILDIEETLIYPDFVFPTKQHDIGMIKLQKDIPADLLLRPVCLPQTETLFANWKSNKTTIVGWSKIEDGSLATHMLYPRNLQTSTMTFERREYCDRFYKRSNSKFGSGRICISGDLSSTKIVCSDDEGGPAMKSIPIQDLGQERVFQIGVVSFQHKMCGQPGIPAGLTNVINYMPWILDNMSLS